jgi:predicted  nucleic acid-binding Zn-ribbon protein
MKLSLPFLSRCLCAASAILTIGCSKDVSEKAMREAREDHQAKTEAFTTLNEETKKLSAELKTMKGYSTETAASSMKKGAEVADEEALLRETKADLSERIEKLKKEAEGHQKWLLSQKK